MIIIGIHIKGYRMLINHIGIYITDVPSQVGRFYHISSCELYIRRFKMRLLNFSSRISFGYHYYSRGFFTCNDSYWFTDAKDKQC